MSAPNQHPPGSGSDMHGSNHYPATQYVPPSAPPGVQGAYPANPQYPSGMPGQMPPSGMPGQMPPYGIPGNLPPSGMPGSYPPSGMPGNIPPSGMPGTYPPSGTPGNIPPSGMGGSYPPSGMPGNIPPPGSYPPSGVPGNNPPSGMHGNYPPTGMPGGYPPSGMPSYYGGTDQYPPNAMPGNVQPGMPGMYPPPGVPGQYTPHGIPGHYPAVGVPPGSGPYPPSGMPGYFPPHGGTGQYMPQQQGIDAEDSDGCDYLRPKPGSASIHVRFTNHTDKKVKLYTIDHKGKFQKMDKVKEGKAVEMSTHEGQPWIAEGKKGGELVINGNVAFIPYKAPGGGSDIRAEITREPRRIEDLRSSTSGVPARVKFSNRTSHRVVLKKVDAHGQWHKTKELHPRKAWLVDSCEGHFWVACVADRESERLHMNHGRYYLVTKGGHQHPQKVLITEPYHDSSSSSDSD